MREIGIRDLIKKPISGIELARAIRETLSTPYQDFEVDSGETVGAPS